MKGDRLVVRISKTQMERMREVLEYAKSQGQPIPSVQQLYDYLLKIGLDAIESSGNLPKPNDGAPQIVVDLPQHSKGRRPKEEAPIRHYLHGDPVVGMEGKYYCNRCDSFEVPGHFGGSGPGVSESGCCQPGMTALYGSRYIRTHEHRYVVDRRKWFGTSIKPHAQRGSRVAIDDPGNLFRTGTIKEQHLPKLEKA